jgi:EmrB/QacA subfamily drug resistance transporter
VGEGRGEGSRSRTLVLIACLIATFMAAVESTIIATAMPTIVGELGGFSLFSWAFTIYLLTQAVSIPIYGRLSDIYGRKPVFFAGASLFLVGSALCGFAWGMVPLIGFRALQGFGAGGVQTIASTILGDIYTPVERGRVQGMVSSVFGVSAVVGPSLGAFLIEHVSWQAVFWVNLPIGAAAIAMLAVFLHETIEHRQHRIDLLGSLLLLVAIGALMLAMVQAGSLAHLALFSLAGLGVVAFVVLLLHEWHTPEPMLPLELWRNRIIVLGSLGNCAAGALMMGVSAFLPAYVQGAMGYSAMAGGLVLGAMSVSWALSSIAAARIMAHTSYRLTAVLGAFALMAGNGVLLTLDPSRGPFWAAAGSFTIGIGMGLGSTTFIVSIQASVPWRQRGAATSSAMFLRFVGQAVGAALCGAVLNASIRARDPSAMHVADQLLDPTLRERLGTAEAARLSDLVASSLHNAYLMTMAFAVIALFLALLMPAGLNPTRHPPRADA